MRLNPTYFMGGEEVRLRGGRGGRGRASGCSPADRAGLSNRCSAFTLLELLVVMAIIGILATIGIPALKGMGGSLDIDAANRQLVDDLAYARLKAINERTRVYMVFVPPGIVDANWSGLTAEEQKELDLLVGLQYRAYALFTERSLGDQPGRYNPRYVTEWRVLPEGTFISPHKFQRTTSESERLNNFALTNRPFAYFPIPFPTDKSKKPDPQRFPNEVIKLMPCIVFDFQGRVVTPGGGTGTDEYITLTKGSIVYPMDTATKKLKLEPAEVIETPRNNHTNNPAVRVDWLTGRTRTILVGGGKG